MSTGYAGQLLARTWVRYALMFTVTLMVAAAFSLGMADDASATHSTAIHWHCEGPAYNWGSWWKCWYWDYYYHRWFGPYYY